MPAMAFPGRPGTSRTATLSATDPRADSGLAPSPPADWPKQATTSIVKVVDTVRDKTTGPALTAAQWVVYGTVMALLAVPVLVFLLVGSIRLLEGGLLWLSQVGSDPAPSGRGLKEPVWIVYLFFGAIFTVAGRILWRKAAKTPDLD